MREGKGSEGQLGGGRGKLGWHMGGEARRQAGKSGEREVAQPGPRRLAAAALSAGWFCTSLHVLQQRRCACPIYVALIPGPCAICPAPATRLRGKARQVEVVLDVVLPHFAEELVALEAAEPGDP